MFQTSLLKKKSLKTELHWFQSCKGSAQMHDFTVIVTYRCVLFHWLLIYSIFTPITLNIPQNTFVQEAKENNFPLTCFCSFFPLQTFPETSIFSCWPKSHYRTFTLLLSIVLKRLKKVLPGEKKEQSVLD